MNETGARYNVQRSTPAALRKAVAILDAIEQSAQGAVL